MDPPAQLSFTNSVSTTRHPSISLSFIIDLIPLACAAIFLVHTICKHSIRRLRKQFGSKEDRSNRKRRLFSVFVTKNDILEGHEIRIPTEAIEADEQVAADVVYSAPGLELALIPLIEVFVRANSTIIAVNTSENWLGIVGKAALAITWLYALFFQISKRSPLASLRLFALYTLLFLRSIFMLVTSLRLVYYHRDVVHSLIFAQVLDVGAIAWILTTVMLLPLRAPLDLVIRLEHGDTEDSRPSSPEDTNTILGEIGYSWMTQLMTLARSRPLQSLDVFALALNNRSEVLSRRFRSLKSRTLTRRLLRASARDIAIDATLKLTAVAAAYCQPFFIQRILEQLVIEHNSPSHSPSALADDRPIPFTPREKAYLYTFLAFLSMLIKTLAQQRHFHFARRIGMRLRSELTVAVFEKSLRRKNTGVAVSEEEKAEGAEAGASVGKVITLVSEDTNRVLRMGCDSHLLYGSPLEIIVGLSLLYNLLGWSAFIGFGVLLLFMPVNYYFGKLTVPVSSSRLVSRDARQSSLQELFSSIRTVKLAGWSQAFIERVEVKRKEELKWMLRAGILRLALIFVWVIISALVSILTFTAYIYLQHQVLTVPVAFTALSFFALIQNPLFQIPDFGVKILQLRISIRRLEAFLGEKEVESHVCTQQREMTHKLGFEKATLKFAGAGHAFELKDLNVEFPRGKLSIVSGPTGSGKTSLLLALLGELDLVSGKVSLPSSVSYGAQQPWLESATVRDNVLFGHSLDESRLKATIKACALETDLDLFPDGDLTFCGERGISLSGGQAARVALARAIYAPSEIVLLDDIFSAVDATTSAHLVEHLFDSPLVADRTIVLITHHIDVVLGVASYHLSMDDGRIVHQGKVDRREKAEAKERLAEDEEEEANEREGQKSAVTVEKKELKKGQAAHVEGWTSGKVKSGMYTTYLSASSWLLWIIVIIMLLTLPLLEFGERLWLAKWGEAANGLGKSTRYYLNGYIIISSIVIVMIILPQAIAMLASQRASRTLFRRLLVRVVHAPLRWIDIIPMGTLSNRFTNDIGTVDDSLAQDFSTFGHQSTTMFVALLASGFILPSAIAPTLLFAGIYGYIFRNYLMLNRDSNRIASTTASPLLASFAEALRGVTSIRAFSKEHQFRHRLCKIVDENLAFWYLSATLDIWLSIRTELLAALCLVSTAAFAIYSGISPGLAGVAIASSQTVINSLSYLCSAYGRLVLDLNALERITEYLEVPQEPVGGIVPSAVWPSSNCEGALVRVEDLVMTYDPALPPVLKGISFEIKPRERIGIVGRTGAGKSTLATALLRFSDPIGGKIMVDGLDIAKVSLDDLRKRITYLPQEATLFESSLRHNIDLFAEHSDEDCLSVLRQVHLLGHSVDEAAQEDSDVVKKTSINLATSVSAGGTNFSAGQRQLIAMARALLQDSRIVIFDESTASLDHRLDDEIQRVVREEFKDAAILTIAHRLRTVRDYDRILVLDAGEIVELDTPDALLEKENGVFRKMWNESKGSKGEGEGN